MLPHRPSEGNERVSNPGGARPRVRQYIP